jgi:hypothetical protein
MVPPTSSGILPRAVMAAMQLQRVGDKARGGIGFFRADQVDQVVRKALKVAAVGLGGADVHVANTCAESTLTSSIGKTFGELKAAAVLPDAVGPMSRMARGDKFN